MAPPTTWVSPTEGPPYWLSGTDRNGGLEGVCTQNGQTFIGQRQGGRHPPPPPPSPTRPVGVGVEADAALGAAVEALEVVGVRPHVDLHVAPVLRRAQRQPKRGGGGGSGGAVPRWGVMGLRPVQSKTVGAPHRFWGWRGGPGWW